MVGKRRFGLLMGLAVLGLFVLWIRLFQVQVIEHDVWAREAANLVRSASLLPYHRGRILDRDERVLAYDDDFYQIELDYRDFRRGHPLGQVAHARSSLDMRPVSLTEALEGLDEWAHALVQLTPNQLLEFGRTGVLTSDTVLIGLGEGLNAQRRFTRASDAHFYTASLLLGDDRLRRKLWRMRDEPKGDSSFIELAAELRETTVEFVQEELDRKLRDARSDLGRLAALLDYGKETGQEPLAALVEDLEGARRKIEDASADELFREATRFAPGRLSTESLARIDSTWIAAMLAWDEARLAEWIDTRREGWLEWARTTGLYRGLLQIDLSYEVGEPAQRLLTELACLFAAEVGPQSSRKATDWRTIDEIACLREFPNLFAVPESERLMEEMPFALPFQSENVRSQTKLTTNPWGLLASAVFSEAQPDPHWLIDEEKEEYWIPPANQRELEDRWRALSTDASMHNEEALRLARYHFDALETALQAEITSRLDVLAANSIGLPGAPLAISSARRTAALKKSRHILRDQSSRPAIVDRTPEFSVVQLVTRWHERYAGLEVRTRTRRLYPEVDGTGTPLASGLLGNVRETNLREVLSQRGHLRELALLQRKRERTFEENLRVLELASEVHHPEEHQGNAGIEGYLDQELRGKNGYVETQGLEERRESEGIELYELPVDGKDVRLTLDLELQAAAQAVLEKPFLPESEPKKDRLWFANPVGAIVLLSPKGDILVAASVPNVAADPPPQRDGEREFVRERCFTKPRHQSPGSVFKPFVALWALENLGWDPGELTDCAKLEGGGAGYESMHCHSSAGHGPLDMHDAIQVSCNAYFARLGEQYTPDELYFMAKEFGFSQSTGLRSLGGRRSGLREEWEFPGFELFIDTKRESERMRMKRQIGNGLSVVEATPGQVARAMCGLLTNSLPRLRLIDSIDGVKLPRESRELGFSGKNLVYVQQAMDAVVNEYPGSAYGSIGHAKLPFRVAGKTGSADYLPFKESEELDDGEQANTKMRKHTWFAGWFPVDDPKAILVVYLHDVKETSTHTSVHVASQFLKSPAVLKFVGAE